MASIGIETRFTFGHKVRRAAIALAVAVATPLAIASVLAGTSAEAQVKKGCPNKIAAACKKNFKRVCSQTDKNGCCTKSACVQN